MIQQRFHSLPTQTIKAVQMINLPRKQALALGDDGNVYTWRDYMGLWFITGNTERDWFNLGLRALAETEGRAMVRSGDFRIRTVRRG